MGLNLMRSLAALAVASLPLAAGTATFTLATAEVAVAGNHGNGNGGGNGNRGGRSSERRGGGEERSQARGHGAARHGEDHPGRGAIASELRGLNACHASEQARASAAPDSQVGRLAIYADAAQATEEAAAQVEALQASYDGRDSEAIQDDIDALDPNLAKNAELLTALNLELDAAEAYELQLASLQAAQTTAAEAENDALLTASGGRELSDAAVAALRDCLGS